MHANMPLHTKAISQYIFSVDWEFGFLSAGSYYKSVVLMYHICTALCSCPTWRTGSAEMEAAIIPAVAYIWWIQQKQKQQIIISTCLNRLHLKRPVLAYNGSTVHFLNACVCFFMTSWSKFSAPQYLCRVHCFTSIRWTKTKVHFWLTCTITTCLG